MNFILKPMRIQYDLDHYIVTWHKFPYTTENDKRDYEGAHYCGRSVQFSSRRL